MSKLTIEQKEANKLARQEAKKQAKELARINAEMNQKPVASIKISIEWVKSRVWGYNPKLEAWVKFQDGSTDYMTATCSGCGYDKESTVIADVFNAYLKYTLYKPLHPVTSRHTDNDGKPYGITIRDDWKYFNGGIGTDCYYGISEAIGGKLTKTASGKSYDAYTFEMNKN